MAPANQAYCLKCQAFRPFKSAPKPMKTKTSKRTVNMLGGNCAKCGTSMRVFIKGK